MADLRRVAPSTPLRTYVRHYQMREVRFDGAPAVWPLPARCDQILEFYLRDRYGVVESGSALGAPAPPSVVVGPRTRRTADLVLAGVFRNFTIHFQPTGFHRLFRVPMAEVADQAVDAPALLGGAVRLLHERLYEAGGFEEAIRLAEQFLLERLPAARPLHPVQYAAAAMLSSPGRVSLGDLASHADLSLRQFERTFRDQVGVSPKLYARIARFHLALELKLRHPSRTWTEITYEAGYFDQAHLVRDFRALCGQSPSGFVRAINPDAVLAPAVERE